MIGHEARTWTSRQPGRSARECLAPGGAAVGRLGGGAARCAGRRAALLHAGVLGTRLLLPVGPRARRGLAQSLSPERVWTLAGVFRVPPDQANPGPDRFGGPAVWRFL